jgi:CheY-like chemotaxis protein
MVVTSDRIGKPVCHVLIIEDDWLIADYVEQLARDAGATSIEIVDCERDAVEAAAGQRPEIILSDVNLRVGTGPLAVHVIQENWGPIPVIFITATPQECVPCGAQAVILTKPLNPKALTETFRQLAPRA